MSAPVITEKTALPLNATDVARLYRKAYGRPTMTEEDFEFADALMRECVLRLGVESLRDKIAAQSLAALIGHTEKDYPTRGAKGVPTLARFAYEYADAMLAEREKGGAA